jgi:integrase
MPRVALTDAAVKRLKPPGTGQIDYFDKGYPGLALRIGSGGARTWVYFARVGKRLVRHRLGSYPDKGLADARELWRDTRERVQAGKPPRARPRDKTAVETVVADWLRRDQMGNATHAEVKRTFDTVILPEWSGRLITSIDRQDILDIVDAAADRGKLGRARKLHAWLARFMSWCVGRGLLEASPMLELPLPGEAVVRDRALSDAEIRALWPATKALGWPYGTIVQLLLLTLARKSEINALRWADIDPGKPGEHPLIRLPRRRKGTKNNEVHIIPLTPLAWHILAGSPKIQGSPYVFTSGSGKPPAGWSKAEAALYKAVGANEPWRVHDFRRTGATNLERLGVPIAVTEAVLGHTSGSKSGIAAVYQQHDYGPEKRAALSLWAGRVLSIVG